MIPPLWSEGKDTSLAETALHFKTRQTRTSLPMQIKFTITIFTTNHATTQSNTAILIKLFYETTFIAYTH